MDFVVCWVLVLVTGLDLDLDWWVYNNGVRLVFIRNRPKDLSCKFAKLEDQSCQLSKLH